MKRSNATRAALSGILFLLAATSLGGCGPTQTQLPPTVQQPPAPPPPPAPLACIPWDGESRSWPAGAFSPGMTPCTGLLQAGAAQATAWLTRVVEAPAQSFGTERAYFYVEGTGSRSGAGAANLILATHDAAAQYRLVSDVAGVAAGNGRTLLSSDFLPVPGDRLVMVELLIQSDVASGGYGLRLDGLTLTVISETTARMMAVLRGRHFVQ